MEYARIIVPAAPMRRKSRHQSEMTSQLLFGEAVKIIKEKKNGWIKLKSLHDNYEGWISTALALQEVTEDDAKTPAACYTSGMLSSIRMNGELLQVPLASALPHWQEGKGRIGELVYETEGPVEQAATFEADENKMRQYFIQWLNAPYQWGGRTILGVDCSGFVQVNFRRLGISLPRDAWQQAQEGDTVEKLKQATCGNLAFFDDKDEIVHVGILLDSEHIIHASGKVRIDKIDKKGIINSTTGKRTHSLRVIRKLW